MPDIAHATTANQSIDDVIARLRRHPAVDGLLLIGSAATDRLTPASDYDLVIVLAEMPVSLHVGVTNIDGRFADLVFCTSEQIAEILAATAPVPADSWTGRLVGWLAEGRIGFDRRGELRAAQTKVRTGTWLKKTSHAARTAAWSRINYNLQVVRRYLAAGEPRYQAAADLRMMLYGPADLFFGYFTIRGLRWRGEKEAIAHLESHDPIYLARFRRFLAAADRQEKAKLYADLAALTIAPVGELWQDESTVMLLDDGTADAETERQALAYWTELLGGSMAPAPDASTHGSSAPVL